MPEFDNPPVVEVVCGVRFESGKPLSAVDLGRYWIHVQSDFPSFEDQPPLNDVSDSVTILSLPELRRVWMLSADKHLLIQLQGDRFFFNWRRIDPKDDYPRYPKIIRRFQAEWQRFCDWAKANDRGPITPNSFDLTYVNHIGNDNGFPAAGRSFDVIRAYSELNGRYLKAPLAMTGNLLFALPDNKGRLHVTIRQQKRASDGTPLLVAELTARAKEVADDKWFDLAHEWIVNGFVDLTTDKAHGAWGYQNV